MGLPSVLVVDDDPELRTLLVADLNRRGFAAHAVRDGAALDGVLAQGLPDILVLDWMLPEEDGPTILRRLRANPATAHLPVLMLTARADDFDRIAGLEMGADDYLTKPFLPRELEARLRAILRRTRGLGGGAAATPHGLAPTAWRIGPWRFDVARRCLVAVDGTIQPLTGSDFALLSLFVHHPGEVLHRDYLMRATRGRESDVFDRAIDVAVSRLRAKLGHDRDGMPLLRTVRGQGYVLSAPVTAEDS
ncbi:DNA-binding response regulator [Hydrogenophilus thermoluteolus]|uniref:response regulator n=1 Tax=Hydrogenophilus thermoluteolus TaxID=297 RepID=UPI0024A44E79|nr:response regulator transcription factor [Hydrogenophilus thermoluteolus]GLW60760.1 DNA-binding response regulator [Hydrogenophilus thermoluteolus]